MLYSLMLKSMPIAMTLAGSDPSAGAGIQGDLKTFAAQGVYGVSVVTSLTAQNTFGVSDAAGVPVALVRAQFRTLREDLPPQAAKTGMLFSAEIVVAVASLLEGSAIPLVVDPVLVSSSGFALMEEAGLKAYREALIPLATVLMPNLDEAAMLLGVEPITTVDGMREAARSLSKLGCGSVYMKGGHLSGSECQDLFFVDGEFVVLSGPRVTTRNTHGTGCALSAAMAANLALGMGWIDAARDAKAFVQGALESSRSARLGAGRGPLDHFWRMKR
ncbi:MAG: bifunctional hydroxymethylpyrimidine kinase/phosphomethylpyrimidine kinase [candidate division FCPU426 bacterium]